ncbi:hypothetical protein NQ315_007165 [Exocentrus adspersus]|uniref:RRM domain-containing protein n=1 Tax=Exocentrus adspersus TaxID=1586481 RepID=A0AAV8WCN3_9CUCU|nr:hypothetical protein NQ315_007165 [Exocentrus adspersus]
MSEEEPMDINEKNDSSGESESSEDEDQELINKAEELERQISSNKYLYDAHVEIVQIYRKLGDLKSLREAYQRFSDCFPLTPKLWLDWLIDEMKIAQTADEQKHVFSLFDKAVEDYLSVELWMEYAQYSIGVSDIETTQRGLTAAGLHVKDGSLLWDTLRELEHAHISLTEYGSEEWKTQVNRLADVFKRQLSVPLLGMERTYEEWFEWFVNMSKGTVDPRIDAKPIEWGYEKALETLDTYKPFEDRLLLTESNEELLDVYKGYIKVVKDPSTVLCLYERAIVTLCLMPDLWLDYCLYAFPLGEVALKVSSRALRNCPWSEELWIMRLRIMENLQKSKDEILMNFEQGLSSISPTPGLELWISYLEYVCRNSRDKIDELFSQAIDQLGYENDPSVKLSRWYARIKAEHDIFAARKIWNSILQHPKFKGSATLWLEYAALQRKYSSLDHLRRTFEKGLKTCTDWPEYIYEEWLMLEREHGSLETVMKCIDKWRSIVVKKEPKIQQEIKDHENTETIPNKGKKRKYDSPDIKSHKKLQDKSHVKETSKGKVESVPPVVNKHIDKDPKKTVFISNLHPSVDEAQLKNLFPNATIISLVLDRKGKSRCYGYVQFATEEEVMTALARDREPLDGRPVFISEIKTDKTEKKPIFKYETKIESNKLFVRGLPKTKTRDEVEEIFKPHGCIDVRLVLHKNGESKGLAYVEFDDEETARKALEATNELKIDDNVITVAISAPPPKRVSSKVNEPVRHPRSRLQVPLIPRSLQIKNAEGNSKDKEVDAQSSSAAPKTNADFRKMMLKK